MPMDFQTRIQTNIVMRKIKYNSKITPFSDITLPIFWVELVRKCFFYMSNLSHKVRVGKCHRVQDKIDFNL